MVLDCYKTLVENLKEIELIAQASDAAINQATTSGRTQGNAMTRAALVLLCGYFEGFVRDIAEEYVEILNEEGVQLDIFPEPLFCAVVEEMAASLQQENNVANFKAAMRPGGVVQLNKKRFSKTGGNPTVDTIEAVFNGIGLPKIIDQLSIKDYKVDSTFVSESQVTSKMRTDIHGAIQKLGQEQPDETVEEIVKLIEAKWSPKQKRRKVGYVNDIEQLLKKRNRIAHGEGNEQITPKDLRDFLKCIENLSGGLHAMVVTLLKRLTEHPPIEDPIPATP